MRDSRARKPFAFSVFEDSVYPAKILFSDEIDQH